MSIEPQQAPPRVAPAWRALDPRKKIAIVGKAPDTRTAAPWTDESWQIWVLNDMVVRGEAPRWDVCFEIHEPDRLAVEMPAHCAWLKETHGKPLVLRGPHAEIPDGLVYPLEEVTAAFGRYITNSVSAMLALAILLRPEEIGLWGVNMAQEDGQENEYSRQRPGCEYFCGIAVGAGIRLTIPTASDLLKTANVYGFESSPLLDKLAVRKSELAGRLAQAQTQEHHWTTQRIALAAMLAELGYWQQFAGTHG